VSFISNRISVYFNWIGLTLDLALKGIRSQD
jgi:hypothetical protein